MDDEIPIIFFLVLLVLGIFSLPILLFMFAGLNFFTMFFLLIAVGIGFNLFIYWALYAEAKNEGGSFTQKFMEYKTYQMILNHADDDDRRK